MRQFIFALPLLVVLSATYNTRANYALFDQATDTISINGNTVLGNAATYEARIQLRGAGGNIYNEWLIKEEDKSFRLTDGDIHAYGYDVNRQSGSISASPLFTQYQWHHIAYVYDGSEERLYLDGQQVAQRSASGNIRNQSFSIASIGGVVRESFRDGFVGLLDTFRISSVARYTGSSFTAPQGDLTADNDTQLLFNFTEPSGSITVTDLSPNASTGYLGAGYTGATPPTLMSTLPLLGDLDFDGFIGIDDLNEILSHWNEGAGIGNPQPGDLTGDGFVGIDDLNLVLGNWNAGTPPNSQANIPEPGTLSICLVCLASLNRRKSLV